MDLNSDLCAAAEECHLDFSRYGSTSTPCTILPTRLGGQKVPLFGPSTNVVSSYAQVTSG